MTSSLPRIRTVAGDRAIRLNATRAEAEEDASGLLRTPAAGEAKATRRADIAPPTAEPRPRAADADARRLVSRLREVLATTTVGDLVRAKTAARRASRDVDGVLVVDAKDSVGDALRALSERGVLSALVTERDEEDDDEMEEDEKEEKKKKKKKKKDPRAVRYRGFLSVNDVVLDLVSRGADEDARETLVRGLAAVAAGGGAATEVEPSREELERAREAWNWPSLPVSEIMSPVNWQDGRVMFAPDDPSFDGVSALSLVASRFFHDDPSGPTCHRVALMRRVTPFEDALHTHERATNARGITHGDIVSMSDVVRSLLRDASSETAEADADLAALLERVTLRDLRLDESVVFTVDADSPAFEAFEQMTRRGLSAAAAVGAKRGRDVSGGGTAGGAKDVVGNVSASDVRGVLRGHSLAMPLREYLAKVREDDAASSSSSSSRSPPTPTPTPPPRLVFCHRSSTFASAVRLLSDARAHHAFVLRDCDGDAAVAASAVAARTVGGVDVAVDDLCGIITLTDVLRRICFEDACE